MEDLPRQKLRDLMARQGRSLCDDPRRCEARLRDVCGAHRREVNLLVMALKEGIAADLLGSQSGIPPAVVSARLTKRLQDNLGLAEDAARWAVDSWAYALGLPFSLPPKKVEKAEPAAVKKPVSPGVEPPPAGGGTRPVGPVRDIDKGPAKVLPQLGLLIAGVIVAVTLFAVFWVANSDQGIIAKNWQSPQNQSGPIATTSPRSTEPGLQLPAVQPTTLVTAASFSSVWIIRDSFNFLIHTSFTLSTDAPPTGRVIRARVIARFYMSDGSPMPMQRDDYADFENRQAAVWASADIAQPPTASFADYVLVIPNTALVRGTGLFAVVSIEDHADGKTLVSTPTPSFHNR